MTGSMVARGLCVLALLCPLAPAAFVPPAGPVLRVSTLDKANQPVPGVQVRLSLADAAIATSLTDAQGHAVFADLRPGLYTLLATKDGFQPVHQADLTIEIESTISLELTMIPALTHSDSVDVSATASPVEQGASAPGVTITPQATLTTAASSTRP